MEEPEPAQLQAPVTYEPPAFTWEEQLTALTACSPPCDPDEICVEGPGGSACVPRGG